VSGRLDKEREAEIQPARMASCKDALEKLGFTVQVQSDDRLQFEYQGAPVMLYPYSGWFTGKTVKDGRGFRNLIKQLGVQSEQ
jgi:hypothetical protein